MSGFNTRSHNASNSTTEQNQDCLKAQRDADIMLFCMMGMAATWLGRLVISLIELA